MSSNFTQPMFNINYPNFPGKICAKNISDNVKAVQCDLCKLSVQIKSQQTFVGLQHVFSVTIFCLPRRLEDVLKVSWRHLVRRLEDVLENEKLLCWTRLQDVLKTCLEDVLKTCLEGVLKTCLEDVLKTSL